MVWLWWGEVRGGGSSMCPPPPPTGGLVSPPGEESLDSGGLVRPFLFRSSVIRSLLIPAHSCNAGLLQAENEREKESKNEKKKLRMDERK